MLLGLAASDESQEDKPQPATAAWDGEHWLDIRDPEGTKAFRFETTQLIIEVKVWTHGRAKLIRYPLSKLLEWSAD